MNSRQPNEDLFENSRMSFGEHLEELRSVLVKSLKVVAICCVIGFAIANPVVRILKKPLEDAIREYKLKDAADNIVETQGFVPPELLPWLDQEKLLPRSVRIDPAELVMAIQRVVPDFAEAVEVDSYGFYADNFVPDRVTELCLQLSNQPSSDETLNSQSEFLWELLTPTEQETVTRIGSQSTSSDADVMSVVRIFNRLSVEAKLYDADPFLSLVTEEESGFFGFLSDEKEKPLAKMKLQLKETPNPDVSRRLNRALLTSAFPGDLNELRMDMVELQFWESSEFKPQSLSASEPFFVWMKAGMLTGLVLAAPFVFYQLWSFVASGLYPHEKHYVHIFLPVSIGLFLLGVLLAFFFVFQPVLEFLFAFNRQLGIEPDIRINEWIGFVMFLPLGFGLAFQLPLVMLFMNRIGLFKVADYLSKWRIAVMIIFVLAMILTPADPISMLLLAIPLTFLYFFGIAMCHWLPKKQNPYGEQERQYTI